MGLEPGKCGISCQSQRPQMVFITHLFSCLSTNQSALLGKQSSAAAKYWPTVTLATDKVALQNHSTVNGFNPADNLSSLHTALVMN